MRSLSTGALALLWLTLASPGHAALLGRDLNGSPASYEAYYDTALNITWLADANWARTSGYDADGQMTFAEANAWAAGLNVSGVTGWRLPGITPLNGVNFILGDPRYTGHYPSHDVGTSTAGVGWGLHNEYAHLYYVTLDNDAYEVPSPNYGPFSNVPWGGSWTNQTAVTDSGRTVAFDFIFGAGIQAYDAPTDKFWAWAVHDGDVTAPVPEPGTYGLMALGLAAVAAAAQRRRPQ